MDNDTQLIFISYTSKDRDRVDPYFDWLKGIGLDVWMDHRRIMAGQNWDYEIQKAFNKAAIILLFVSNNSIDKRGYVQRELKQALDKYQEKLIDDIYIIPVLLDSDIEIPDQLSKIQCITAKKGDEKSKIRSSIEHQLKTLDTKIRVSQEESNIRWSLQTHRDAWDGLPGYELEFNHIFLSSTEYPSIEDISTIVNGEITSLAIKWREAKHSQDPKNYAFGQQKFRRTNLFDAHCSPPLIKDSIISIQYMIQWYGCGAAHENYYYKTFAFYLNPVLQINTISDIFVDKEAALGVLQRTIRQQLLNQNSDFDLSWVEDGTANWDSFHSFVFKEDGLEILFPPYQVASFADGPQASLLKYKEIAHLMRPETLSALNIDHLVN